MKRRWWPWVWVLVAGCTAVPAEMRTAPQVAPAALETATVAPARKVMPLALNQPQLARKAILALEVTDAEAASQQVIRWTRAVGGELLNLSDNGVKGEVRRLTLEVQVPAPRLEELLERLGRLGKVERREVTAEDVSDQLVDVGARLRNLRQAEALLLQIMERSGSVADVLKVTQELTQVREQIEQLDAQRLHLHNRVRYAQIQVYLTTPPGEPPLPSVGERLGKTWQAATRALGQVTLGAMELALWLVVFSPFILGVGFPLVWLTKRVGRPLRIPTPPPKP